MEPLQGTVTVEKIAANAVIAGCRPEYFPVVLASVRAVLQPDFHVGSTACTTGGSAPLIIVNGPIAARLGISGGTACFGGNIKANATIGRALRLIMRNLGGAKPDGMEKSTQAWPSKIACCFAENEARSPWEPLHVERGYPAEASDRRAVREFIYAQASWCSTRLYSGFVPVGRGLVPRRPQSRRTAGDTSPRLQIGAPSPGSAPHHPDRPRSANAVHE